MKKEKKNTQHTRFMSINFELTYFKHYWIVHWGDRTNVK